MNNETKENIRAAVFAITFIVVFLGIGMVIGHYVIPYSQDDVMHIQKTVYTTATTIVSISKEEVDCKKQGGGFMVLPLDKFDEVTSNWTKSNITGFRLICETPVVDSKILSSKTISVGN